MMAIDCVKFTANAQAIFEKLKAFYPPDPWQKPQWTEEGTVYSNGWYDLRTSADRAKLEEWVQKVLGHWTAIQASLHRKEHGSLEGFTRRRFSRAMQHEAELLLLLQDLDFQIETLDLVGD